MDEFSNFMEKNKDKWSNETIYMANLTINRTGSTEGKWYLGLGYAGRSEQTAKRFIKFALREYYIGK
jgi:hypothetical protein